MDTPRLLDLLDRHHAKATFFVIGNRAALHPELLAEINVRGHQVGHHTQTHPVFSFWCATRPACTPSSMTRWTSSAPPTSARAGFVPPVGIKNFLLPAALAERKLQCVGWSVRSGDCLGRRPEKVVKKVMRHVRPGAILLMHEGPSVPAAVRVTAIAGVLEGLTANNYRCVLPAPEQLR